jgi:hypothetical protein
MCTTKLASIPGAFSKARNQPICRTGWVSAETGSNSRGKPPANMPGWTSFVVGVGAA